MPEVSCQGTRADHAPQFCGFPAGGIRIFARVFVSFHFPLPAPSPGVSVIVYALRGVTQAHAAPLVVSFAAVSALRGGCLPLAALWPRPWLWKCTPCGLRRARMPCVLPLYPLRGGGSCAIGTLYLISVSALWYAGGGGSRYPCRVVQVAPSCPCGLRRAPWWMLSGGRSRPGGIRHSLCGGV